MGFSTCGKHFVSGGLHLGWNCWDIQIFVMKKTINFMVPFTDGTQLYQGYRATTRRVYFLPLSTKQFLVLVESTSETWKAESLWSHPGVLNPGGLDWESSTLNTKSLFHKPFPLPRPSSPIDYRRNWLKITFNIHVIICYKQEFKNSKIHYWKKLKSDIKTWPTDRILH